MTEEEIVERLVAEFGYHRQAAALVAEDLLGCTEGIREAFADWWSSGELPELSVEGFTLRQLIEERGMKPPAALVTLDWLVTDPEQAKASLARGHDRIETTPDSAEG